MDSKYFEVPALNFFLHQVESDCDKGSISLGIMGLHHAHGKCRVKRLLTCCSNVGLSGILRLDGWGWMVYVLKSDHGEGSDCGGNLLFLLSDLLGNWRHTEN